MTKGFPVNFCFKNYLMGWMLLAKPLLIFSSIFFMVVSPPPADAVSEKLQCTNEIGGPIIDRLPGNSSRDVHLILNATFPCDGTVRAWLYHKTDTDASVFLSVWRRPLLGPETENYYQLVGKNRIPLGSKGKRIFRVKPKYRIHVKAGDFLGYHYSIHHKTAAIAVVNDTYVADEDSGNLKKFIMLHQHTFFHDTITAGLYDENFLLGTPINFNTNDRKTIRQRNAVAALLDYGETNSTTTAIAVCWDQMATIECLRGFLSIEDAHFDYILSKNCSSISILKSTFLCNFDAWPVVNDLCGGQRSCSFRVDQELFGKVCNRKSKKLVVTYTCLKEVGTVNDDVAYLKNEKDDGTDTTQSILSETSEKKMASGFPSVATTTLPTTTIQHHASTLKFSTEKLPVTESIMLSITKTTSIKTSSSASSSQQAKSLTSTDAPKKLSNVKDAIPALKKKNDSASDPEELLAVTIASVPASRDVKNSEEGKTSGSMVPGVLLGILLASILFGGVFIFLRHQNRKKDKKIYLVQSNLLGHRLRPNPIYESISDLPRRVPYYPNMPPDYCIALPQRLASRAMNVHVHSMHGHPPSIISNETSSEYEHVGNPESPLVRNAPLKPFSLPITRVSDNPYSSITLKNVKNLKNEKITAKNENEDKNKYLDMSVFQAKHITKNLTDNACTL